MPIQIHRHQLNRKTVTGILITWKSGAITCIQKTPATMDMREPIEISRRDYRVVLKFCGDAVDEQKARM